MELIEIELRGFMEKPEVAQKLIAGRAIGRRTSIPPDIVEKMVAMIAQTIVSEMNSGWSYIAARAKARDWAKAEFSWASPGLIYRLMTKSDRSEVVLEERLRWLNRPGNKSAKHDIARVKRLLDKSNGGTNVSR